LYNNLILFKDNSDVEKTEDEVIKIKKWALQNNISQVALQELIDILRNVLPQLPVSAKSFIGTKYTYNIETFVAEEENYQYVYFGLREGLQSCINTALHNREIPLQINIDGIPLYKSSRK